MKKDQTDHLTRRSFIRQSACAALGVTGLVDALAHLTLVNSALADTSTLPGYKALVVLYLLGGNDGNNMLIPRYGHPEYENYKTGRRKLTIWSEDELHYPAGEPKSEILVGEGGPYGVHYNLPKIAGLYNNDELAFVANVGSLAYPITRDQYINKTVEVPPQLFSHADQMVQWQSSIPDKPFETGWGGRIADLLYTPSPTSLAMCVSLGGINKLQVGGQTVQYCVGPDGATPLQSSHLYGANTAKRVEAFNNIMQYTNSHLLEQGYNQVVRQAGGFETILEGALDPENVDIQTVDYKFADHLNNDAPPQGLKAQLCMIAKLIARRGSLGNSRQIFFCNVSGYDTHHNQWGDHEKLMAELDDSLSTFNDCMHSLGVHNNVLTITQSDFTRTLTPNKEDRDVAGTDHGWGGHQIVMGGPVVGGKVYGHFPSLVLNANLDSGNRGRWIPTTSVDQYCSVAARWLGVSSGKIYTIFPNLRRFTPPSYNAANLSYIRSTELT